MEQINESSKETLTDNEKYTILSQLFHGRPVDSSFLYKGDGAELYKKLSEDKTYPFMDIEMELLERLKGDEKFKYELYKTEYITDVGCGDGQKAVSLLGGTNRYGVYVPEDFSWNMMEIAKNNIGKDCHITVGSLVKLNTNIHLTSNCDNNMYLFLGGTICNMTDNEIIEELKGMDNNGTFNGNKILLSYFSAPETEDEIAELIKIYNSENNRLFHENGMKMLGLSKDDFEFDTVYEKDDSNQKEGPFPGKIKGVIRAKRDCTVKISDKESKTIKKGEEFTLHYSRRFSKEGIENLFKEAKCKIKKTINEKGDTLVLLEKEPLHLKSLKTKIEKLLLGILALSSLATAGHFYDKSEKNERINQAQELWESEHEGNEKLIYYPQQTQALIVALNLDDINPNNKKAIEDIFNVWLSEQDQQDISGFQINEIVQKFWDKYGEMLILNYGLVHSPYDFMTRDLINNSLNFEGDIGTMKKNYYRNINLKNFVKDGEIKTLGIWQYVVISVDINGEKKDVVFSKQGTDKKFTLGNGIVKTGNLGDLTLRHIMSEELITNTENLYYMTSENLVIYHKDKNKSKIECNEAGEADIKAENGKIIQNTIISGKVFEYIDNGSVFLILKVDVQPGHSIYLAANKSDENDYYHPIFFNTNTFNSLSDKSSFDTNAVNNTGDIIGNRSICMRKNHDSYESAQNLPSLNSSLIEVNETSNTMYFLNGKVYYIKIIKLCNGQQVGLASLDPDGSFEHETFIQIVNDYNSLMKNVEIIK